MSKERARLDVANAANELIIAALKTQIAELELFNREQAQLISVMTEYYEDDGCSDLLEAHNLEQQANALSDYAYSNEPLTKRGLNIKAIALRVQAAELKESSK